MRRELSAANVADVRYIAIRPPDAPALPPIGSRPGSGDHILEEPVGDSIRTARETLARIRSLVDASQAHEQGGDALTIVEADGSV